MDPSIEKRPSVIARVAISNASRAPGPPKDVSIRISRRWQGASGLNSGSAR
jgi:hypothetical protein